MIRRAIPPIVALFALGTTVDVVVGFSPFPGYGAAIGLFGCIAIVVVSKWLGSALLERPEDYYPDEVPPDLQVDLLPSEHPDHPGATFLPGRHRDAPGAPS